MSVLPENMVSYMVYLDGDTLLGTAGVDLPSLDALTEKVKGAGIAGEVDAPVLGHYAEMGLTISWRTITGNLAVLAAPEAHALTFRGSQQTYDSSEGTFSTVPVKIIVKATPKKTSLGKFVIAGQTDSKNEFEVSYIKIYVDGDEIIEIDKYNMICTINGTDYLESVRSDLGMS
ncbi:MAG: major tail tube protein [Firmicutes bacterium]|nr:major tail tube protein [Bacillota bacterium]